MTQPTSAAPTDSPSHEAPRRILVVESDVATADQITPLLEGMGFSIQLASDAKTALLSLNDFAPHLVLLGTYLSDMPGYELTAILRGAPQYSSKFQRVGLLYLADREKIVKHRLVGAPTVPMSQYLFKPLNETEVRDKVRRELAKYTE